MKRSADEFKVKKRNGDIETVSFDKISERIRNQSKGLCVNITDIARKVIDGLQDGVETKRLDTLAAENAAYMSTVHPDYDKLAANLMISNLHKETSEYYKEVIERLYTHVSVQNGKHNALVSKEVYDIVMANTDLIQSRLDYTRDFGYSYFAFKTLCKSFLIRIGDTIIERPQHFLMRVALGMYGIKDLNMALDVYDHLSNRLYAHASPTLFFCGTQKPQCSSCFLLSIYDDSIDGIYETLRRCAKISQCSGGIGFNIHRVRAEGSYINGSHGTSNGLLPMLRVYNDTGRYVDQGGGKRKGAFATYVEPWHRDIFGVIDMKRGVGPEETRVRDLFPALWIPDLFMRRVENDEDWTLMCPDQCRGLHEVYGEEFDKLYTHYEQQKFSQNKTVKAQELWNKILECQIESGVPYMLYKDACNKKSNQKNLGTIEGSNLCTEVIQYVSENEIAVCNLASISLPACLVDNKFSFDTLYKLAWQLTMNLNRVIDINYYPLEQAKNSNMKHRPIGIGVQGLQDVFFRLRYPFESNEARELNKTIFETIYFAACSASIELAKKDGPYQTFKGSPASQGKFQFDLWAEFDKKEIKHSGLWNWDTLRVEMMKHGLRNSLLCAVMPTATTAQILNNTECIEPIISNVYQRRTLAGDFMIVNKYLIDDLSKINKWDINMKNKILANGGSIQNIDGIPENIKGLYKTVWEISQKVLVDLSIDRGIYIDQSQSLNIFMKNPTFNMLTSCHFYAWERGAKTGMYYLKSPASADAVQFTVPVQLTSQAVDMKSSFGNLTYEKEKVCDIGCDSCGA